MASGERYYAADRKHGRRGWWIATGLTDDLAAGDTFLHAAVERVLKSSTLTRYDPVADAMIPLTSLRVVDLEEQLRSLPPRS